VDSDEQARSTCGVLDLRQQRVRRSVWQWRRSAPADVDDLLVAIGWRRGFGAAPAMMVAAAPSTRHSPPPGDIGVVLGW
jgi:hypothetical protein